ncbi:hypothetical protein POJ06DRAFT_254960 [Lipomyces tetrasporus]|uniref:Chitobiosyldiphosphodolichol beta-mannosyltransferase n=1 Tax=Lipomyces tetrasporus TaxID=54092 RepID=A0AAD7VSE2_9ASCO|nr:uncharacterized protein POJ06DRAFT_254960 [Lipomyces tetrasporus]KAJ8099941.1 hypothetical protein POJ06DRAFT_254960 [Lipomyces tetrasporus]
MAFTTTVAICLGVYFLIPVGLYLLVPRDPTINPRKRAIALVLGDIGRSPRMQYHVLSLVETGFLVDFVGYTDTAPLQSITENPDIKVHGIKPAEDLPLPKGLPFIVLAAIKVVYLTKQLFQILRSLKNAEYLLVQNPPSLPTMLVCYVFVTFISRRTRYIIDWHNFGYTVLALKLGSDRNILVRISKWYEHWFCRYAFAHFCVTKAMAEVLVRDFKVNAFRIVPLPDRPAVQFQPLSDDKRADLLATSPIFSGFSSATDKLVVTSTSYTPDEDLTVLLDALSQYDSSSTPERPLPKILTVVTGKGPLQEQFLKDISHRSWNNAQVRTVWLSAEEYPVVIGAADIGVSLHLSTSGWDLPMKVVDMFGCGVPVLAREFPALSELVVSNRNGLVFKTADDLAKQLIDVFTRPELLRSIKRGALVECGNRWSETWRITAGPVFHIPNREDLTEVESSSSSDGEY